ncbi:hypothetical protein CDAR_53821 [Caerostris darwini]|uniref:Uncharacterized protein n=1 Tax=Caerostris darwini TaxID=1538125 RepID=A0AAV4X0J9_9ARAC|nr:hypothetical protein CDAR_53821 [Caerostris darwini]
MSLLGKNPFLARTIWNPAVWSKLNPMHSFWECVLCEHPRENGGGEYKDPAVWSKLNPMRSFWECVLCEDLQEIGGIRKTYLMGDQEENASHLRERNVLSFSAQLHPRQWKRGSQKRNTSPGSRTGP